MNSLYNELLNVLKTESKYFTEDGEILKNAIYEDAMKMDSSLIKLLLSNDACKNHFFTNIDGVLVFDKVGFGWVINNRQFLPDSYTRYKNKIGLTDANENFISASNDVVLAFPYKDCVLEGGQTKEDQKKNEIFYNETLAPDEVDRLLYPKVFSNAKRYSQDGIFPVSKILPSDNLVIKGNNLLAISSLLKKYEGTVKCIYIDIPYNTGNDSFGYNDKFNHSTWLTFIKNRLEVAHRLLNRSGTIAISVDNYEIGYLLVLLDEIFGKENRKNIITVKRGSVTGAKVINPGVVNVVEYVVLYSKDATVWKPNRVFAAKGYDDRYNVWIENKKETYDKWNFTTVLEKWAEVEGVKKSQLKKKYGEDYEIALTNFVIENAENIGRWAALDENSIGEEAKKYKKKSLEIPDTMFYLPREGANDYYIRNGNALLFAKDRLLNIDGKLTFSQPISDIWDDVLPNDLHNEGGVEFKKGKKPEKLISRIIELCTNPKDLIVDFFAGSGTTGAVAIKLGRQFILCEQMDYVEGITCARLKNTILGDSRGVSAEASWQGGGSFVYCELAKLNQKYVEQIEKAETDDKLKLVWKDIQHSGFISSYVEPKELGFEDNDFNALSFEDKKRVFLALLDKNMLYVNYCDMNDETFAISEEDKAFTNSFYKKEI